MLIEVNSLRDLSLGQLMRLYEEENRSAGKLTWPQEPEPRQLALAEEDAIDSLRRFFWLPGTGQYIWQEDDRYRSALRLEPWRDGMLLTALSTAQADRGRGYATMLLRAVLERQDRPVYSHIAGENQASIRVHEKSGFIKISDTAVLLDGSASSRMGTYVCRK